MEETMMTMALIALRGLTVLPGETKHFDISRKKSIASLQQAMVTDQKLFLVTQKSPDVQEPSREELWNMGTIAEIRQLVKLPGNIVRVMVEGKDRGKLLSLESTEPSLTGQVERTPFLEDVEDDLARETMVRIIREKLEEYGGENSRMGRDVLSDLMLIPELDRLMIQTAIQIPWDYTVRQEIQIGRAHV